MALEVFACKMLSYISCFNVDFRKQKETFHSDLEYDLLQKTPYSSPVIYLLFT